MVSPPSTLASLSPFPLSFDPLPFCLSQIGKEEVIVICRWHGSIHKQPQKFFQRTSAANKYPQQFVWIQDKKTVSL